MPMLPYCIVLHTADPAATPHPGQPPELAGVTGPVLLVGSDGRCRRAGGAASPPSECAEPSPLAAAAAFCGEAARTGAHLLVLFADASIGAPALHVLMDALERDPLNGCATPRLSPDPERRWIHPLHPDIGDRGVPVLPSVTLDHVPDTYRFTEHWAPCLLIRNEVLAGFGPLDEGMETLAGAFSLVLQRARRAGYRTVVANRAVGKVPRALDLPHPARPDADMGRLRHRIPDWQASAQWYLSAPEHVDERFVARRCHPSPAVRKTLLLDATFLKARHDGTVEATVHLLQGLDRAATDIDLALAVPPDAAAFHHLPDRLRRIEILRIPSERRFSVGLRLAQPWSLTQLAVLNQMAACNLFLMHDTIAWDAVYPAPAGLDEVWRTMARTADGLVFNSEFSKARWMERFPVREPACLFPLRFPTHPDAYRAAAASRPFAEPYVFVVGNRLDHKALPQTLRRLAAAFPALRFVALGYEDASIPNLSGLPSGQLADAQVEALYAHAAAIVFPSFYEGFGFPVVRGLSYDRPVLARRSALLLELAAHYRGPGRLATFDNADGLVTQLAAVLDGAPCAEVPLGTALRHGQEPEDWTTVAQRLLTFVEGMMATPNDERRRERAFFFQAMAAFHRERAAASGAKMPH